MEKTLSEVQTSMYSFGYGSLKAVDGDIQDPGMLHLWFFIWMDAQGGSGYKISSLAGIFTAKLTTLLRYIREDIQPLETCLILTDSLSSVKALLSRKKSHRTHPLVYECKEMCSDLLRNGVQVEIM
jgi:hypothetical protein